MTRGRPYSEAIKREAIARVRDGMTRRDAARQMDLPERTVARWCREAIGKTASFGEANTNAQHSDRDVELARDLREAGLTRRAIAEKLEVPESTVEQWTNYRTRTGQRTYYAERRQRKKEAA